ncbi:hypothetical protein Q7P36_010507 [Cladosporium allicinum]
MCFADEVRDGGYYGGGRSVSDGWYQVTVRDWADGRAAKVEDLSDKAQWESRAEQSRAAQRIGRVKSSDRVSSGGRNGVGRGGGRSQTQEQDIRAVELSSAYLYCAYVPIKRKQPVENAEQIEEMPATAALLAACFGGQQTKDETGTALIEQRGTIGTLGSE